MPEPTVELPAWVIAEGRSLSYPARWVLVELFVQGERVNGVGGVEYMRWEGPLETLRACAPSSVQRSKHELLGRGLLIEQPGGRVVNGKRHSAWLVPVAVETFTFSEDTPISVDPPISVRPPEDTPKSVLPRRRADSKLVVEDTPISVSPSRTRARGLEQQQQTAEGRTNNTNNIDQPNKETSFVPGGEREGARPTIDEIMAATLQAISNPVQDRTGALSEEGRVRRRVALEGLTFLKFYPRPEQAIADFGVEHCLAAVEHVIALMQQVHVARPGGAVRTWLDAHKGREVVPVADLSFARHWDATYAAEMPSNVREFGRRAK